MLSRLSLELWLPLGTWVSRELGLVLLDLPRWFCSSDRSGLKALGWISKPCLVFASFALRSLCRAEVDGLWLFCVVPSLASLLCSSFLRLYSSVLFWSLFFLACDFWGLFCGGSSV